MNILKIIEETGNAYKKTASTGGGEFKGPCPWCGGDDRFSIQPEQDRYICRHCKKSGDAVQFYRDYHNMSYHNACDAAGQTPNFSKIRLIDKFANTENWTPRENTIPNKIWQAKAEAVTFSAFKYLMSAAGKPHREYLHSRGLSVETIKKARIGFVDTAISFDPTSWGLQPQNKNIWVPRGIIIPYFHPEKGLLRLRIRQDKPTTSDRYILVAGSSMEYFLYPNPTGHPAEQEQDKPVYITEAELDGWLCWQSSGGQSIVMAIGNSSTRPDKNTHKILTNSTTILLGLDNDPAGQKECDWWKRQYKQAQTCGVPKGKDPGEAFEQGVDLSAWFFGQMKTRGLFVDTAGKKNKPQTVAVSLISELENSVIPVPKKQNKICLHNQYCPFLRGGFCTIANNYISDMEICPKNKWWLYRKINGSAVAQIILGPGVKKH